MSLIIYLALIAAAVVALRHGPAQALLRVYLPVLLLLPDSFKVMVPGLPGHPNFNQAAIVPIVLLALSRHRAGWKFAPMDGLMCVFVLWVSVSDYVGRGYADAQNSVIAMLTSVMAPYIVARLLIVPQGLQVAFARRLVVLVFGVALIGLWEFRFGFNPFLALLQPLFPGQAGGWVTTFRHGMARVAGPYLHAILAGIVMALAFQVQRWLQWGEHWEPRFRHLPWLTLPKAKVITAVLFAGMLMTVARGPWVGALIGAGLALVGEALDRRRALRISAALVLVGALLGAWLLSSYLDIKPGTELTASQESALYRKVLFEKYLDIAIDHAWLGWGVTTWPKVRGMESIDNYYLLLALMHGLPATLMLLLMLLGASVQCMRRGLAEPADQRSPAFTLAGVFLTIFVSLGTVYLGGQVLPLLFLMLGWSQGMLQHKTVATDALVAGQRPLAPPPRPEFRGIIA
ncbi:O-antigen ligase family protein [Paucibacter sp. AS339]|uniref:O-antigen ligase family protein n=1 Tax=Paucibacter hankyongi TaxID=3133434 RepID=UPI0030B7D6F6